MTVPANLQAEAAPWGAIPVTLCFGTQGGPYTVVGSGNVLPVGGGIAVGQAVAGNPALVGGKDQSGNVAVAGIRSDGTLQTAANLANADGVSAATGGLWSAALIVQQLEVVPWVFNGASRDRQRTPNVFKTAQASASGDTALWTPTAGKKFRLMKFKLQVPANCTLSARGILTVKLRDGTTDIGLTHDVWLGQTAITTDTNPQQPSLLESGWIDLGNGVLSSTINNVLNINLSAALTNGNVRVLAAGTEE
jgi:hypothetical protein